MYQATLPPASNRADWTLSFELVDDETGETFENLTGMTVKIEVRENGCYGALLTASTTDGKVTDNGGGVFQWTFSRSDMTRLAPGTYDVGVTIERDGFTTQFLIGTLPILDGIVSR